MTGVVGTPRRDGQRIRRGEYILAALAAAGPGAALDLIRVQVLLFLIDRSVSDRIGGPFFHFRPYVYGPFDRAIHDVIQEVVADGHARIDMSLPCERYGLTEAGRKQGETALGSLPDPVADYFARAARWARLMPYRHMLVAIYRRFPDMAVNSVARQLGFEHRPRRQNPFIRGMARMFDITGTMFRSPDSAVGLESDVEAIRDTWRSVGRDLEDSMVEFGESERFW